MEHALIEALWDTEQFTKSAIGEKAYAASECEIRKFKLGNSS